MTFVNTTGDQMQPGELAAWIDSLPEPKRTEYETIRLEGIAANHETEGFVRIMQEYATATGYVSSVPV